MVPLARQEPGSGLGLSEVAEDAWLADLLGKPAHRVGPGASKQALAALPSPGFAYAKVDAADVRAAVKLQDAGFRVVDLSVTFSRAVKAAVLPPPSSRVAPVGSDAASAVLDIAGSAFRYSRFHLDPQIPPELAHSVKREWIRSYVEGRRGETLYAVWSKDKPSGFLAVLVSGRQAMIDLIAVAPACQGRGLGRELVRFFVNEYGKRCDELLVGTQAANVPSMRLYESCGFLAAKTALVLHRHR